MNERYNIDPADLLAAIIMSVMVVMCCHSCKSHEVAASHTDSTHVYTAHLDSLMRSHVERDSVYLHDSVYVYRAGDTVLMERYQWRDRWRTKTDTLFIYKGKTDSVYVAVRDTVTQTVEVEGQLNTWQKARMAVGDVAMILLGIAVIVMCVRWWWKKKKKSA